MHLLVTGGAGYIGSHTTLRLLEAGHRVHVLDDLSNSSFTSLERVRELTDAGERLTWQQGDVRSSADLDEAFDLGPVDAVIHFAGLKAVGESVEQPARYLDVNVGGTLQLVRAMERHGCRTLVFSSSATVYSPAASSPLTEDAELGPINPYGRSKLLAEECLATIAGGPGGWAIAALRYFNPIGAHPSGRIGEDPAGVPNNLLPFVAQVAVGRRPRVQVFGDDYPTADGTGVRDYLHVLDLADGHLAALEALRTRPGMRVWNLGTGRGSSVFEVIAAFEEASGCRVPHEVIGRRAGDQAVVYADPGRAEAELGWRAQRDLATMCADSWAWQHANPRGYAG